MTLKYSQLQLKSKLMIENLNQTTLYYSLVKKQGKNISFISNDRLLIYDSNRKILFYNNDFKSTPFRNTPPNPKNDVFTPLQQLNAKNPNNSNQLQVRYTGKNSKGELQTIEWNFICETQSLAKQWIKLLQDQKNRLTSPQISKDKGMMIQSIIKSKNKSPPKQSIIKGEQIYRPEPLQQRQENIYNSRLSSFKKSQIFKRQEIASNSKVQIPQIQKRDSYDSDPLDLSNLRQNSILKSNKNINNDSRIYMQESQVKRIDSSLNQKQPVISIVKPKQILKINESKQKIQRNQYFQDWNRLFLKNSNQLTIRQFQSAAITAFRSVWQRDVSILSDIRRVYQSNGLKISMCNLFTEQARLIKRQFRNYHFIIQSCKAKLVVGVPLACLIQWQGVVALVKAPIPSECEEVQLSQVINEIRELQRYTRVSNTILEKATIYDVSNYYGSNGDKKLIYLDNLVEYLPLHIEDFGSKTSLRPQYLLDSVGQVVPGGQVKPVNRFQWKQISNICGGIQNCISDLLNHLSHQQTLWTNSLQLKDIFHQFGVNLKYLPKIYNEVSNKHVKKYIYTVMVAKVAKDMFNGIILDMRNQRKLGNINKITEDYIRKLIDSNNNNSQLWKDLSLRFKKNYGITFNNNDLLGGFFLNSLIKLLRLNCDLTKLNKTKKIFKDDGLIGQGFIISIQPKCKIYNRFTTQFIQKIKYACKQQKKDENIYNEIVNTLHLQNNLLPQQYSSGLAKQYIFEYLSYYTPPKSIDNNIELRNINIYGDIFKQPPTAFSLKITKVYLNWCIKRDKQQQFKRGVENILKIADYWLEQTHIFHCALYQLLSDYYASLGNGQESINFMKQALSKCIRICGAQSKEAGLKYYELGQRELKIGRKKQALQNFNKAKINMESNQNQTIKYPQLLMRLSALHLNNGNVEACIEGALQTIKRFEQYQRQLNGSKAMTEPYKIKTFEVLSRAYEISGKKQELKQMANLCAKNFNKTREEWTYEQMLRICLAAVICRYPTQKCDFFFKHIKKVLDQEKIDSKNALRQLMNLSGNIVVMERFISKFDQIQKIIAQASSKRGSSQEGKEFLQICKLLGHCVGEDYIEGLVHQKQFQ